MSEIPGDTIKGWKLISAHVNLSERHLRRLVEEGAFPIQREGTGARAPVMASKEDLDRFIAEYWAKKETALEPDSRPPIRLVLMPGMLALIWLALLMVPKYDEAPYLKGLDFHKSREGISAIEFEDQYGNRVGSLPIPPEKVAGRTQVQLMKEAIIWCPHVEETPVFMEILTSPPNQVRIHQHGIPPGDWAPPTPWVMATPATLDRIMRMKTPAYDGIGLLWTHEQEGCTFQLFNRRKQIIAELFSCRRIDEIQFDRRHITVCMDDGESETLNLWAWITESGMKI